MLRNSRKLVIYSSKSVAYFSHTLKVMYSARRRLNGVLSSFSTSSSTIGSLKLGDITFDIPSSKTPSRLPHLGDKLVNIQDAFNLDNLHFLLQKYLLGQDVFLLSQPGPYARRLALTFCR
jgi:von Willebrand factor A domain-containing protein 8